MKKFLSHKNIFDVVSKLADKYIPSNEQKLRDYVLSMFNDSLQHNRESLDDLIEYLNRDKNPALRAFKKYIIALDKKLPSADEYMSAGEL